MAQSQKTISPGQVVSIPNALARIVDAFSVKSEDAAKTLFEQAAAAIYYEENDAFSFQSDPRPISKQEIDGVYALMKAIKPNDVLETLYAAQIVVGHMLGMRKLAQSCRDDLRLGLKLLRLSNDAMDRLVKKRNEGHQNINVTYNNLGPTNQALITSTNRSE